MNNLFAQLKTPKYRAYLLAGMFIMLISIAGGAHSAHALSNIGPDSSDYGNSARYTLEDTSQLSVTSSTTPVYYASNPGTILVTADSFSFENNPSAHPQVSFNNRAGINSSATFPLGGFTYDANSGYWVALIDSKMTNSAGTYKVISYKLSVPGAGIIGSYAANGSNSAISNQNRCDSNDRSGCGAYYNFSLPFGTPCQAQGSISMTATIYDGDNGNIGVQPTDFSVSILDETTGQTVAYQQGGTGTGNGQTASYQFTALQYHKYRFKVNNIYSNNVMQINLPADGIYYLSDCRTLEKTDRIYGSWGEYGVMATGRIFGIGSGSAFAGHGLSHATTCSYTFLTISNATSANCKSTPAASYGNYTTARSIPDVAGNFPIVSSTPTLSGTVNVSGLSGTYKTSGALVISGGALQKGQSVVINTYNSVTKQYQDVTITGDIKYTTDPMTSAGQIPQLIILAKNVNIKSNVVQVDAWVSAEGTLNTCSDINRTSITINNCNQLLTINGPVMANQVQLWRTAGSSNNDNSGDPAEVFNLRPDAYLWGISQSAQSGRLDTIYEHELPPRY